MASSSKDLGCYDITLYHMRFVRSTRVKWLLHEMGVIDKVKIANINLQKGDQKTPEFLAINKMGTLPALTMKEKDGDTNMVMTESSGICLWLADIVPEGGMKPSSDNLFGLGQYYRFITFAGSSMDSVLWQIRLHEQVLPEDMRVKHVADGARKSFLEKIIPVLEDVFGSDDGVEFICEPYHKGFTAADIMVGYALYWATMYGLLEDSPVLQQYLGRVMQRKGFLEATEEKAAL